MHKGSTSGTGRALAALLGIGLACGATAAQALSVSASAALDWSSFSLTFISGSGTLDEVDSDVYLQVYGPGGVFVDDDYDYAPDWSTPLNIGFDYDDGTSQAALRALAGADDLRAQGSFTTTLPSTAFDGGEAYANASRYGMLEMAASGLVVITVPYFLNAATDHADAWANAWVSLSVSRDPAPGVSSFAYSTAEVFAELGYAPSSNDVGTLALAFSAHAGDTVYFYADADVDLWIAAPVPLPPAVWMLGTGLALLLRRRA